MVVCRINTKTGRCSKHCDGSTDECELNHTTGRCLKKKIIKPHINKSKSSKKRMRKILPNPKHIRLKK